MRKLKIPICNILYIIWPYQVRSFVHLCVNITIIKKENNISDNKCGVTNRN